MTNRDNNMNGGSPPPTNWKGGYEESAEEKLMGTNEKYDTLRKERSPLKGGEGGWDPADHDFDVIEDIKVNEFPKNKHQIQLTWKDIKIKAIIERGGCCSRQEPEEREILKGVSGTALPGDFISIIGASGAGKTTLLNHLSGRLTAKELIAEGEILMNGQSYKEIEGFSQYSAYV